jgi:hypothetical protein
LVSRERAYVELVRPAAPSNAALDQWLELLEERLEATDARVVALTERLEEVAGQVGSLAAEYEELRRSLTGVPVLRPHVSLEAGER